MPRTEDAADVERVVSRLDAIALLWRALPVGGELVFEWPDVVPTSGPAERRAARGTVKIGGLHARGARYGICYVGQPAVSILSGNYLRVR